jgi:uncharacterized protein Yka (UPF0111/DUF47 family)
MNEELNSENITPQELIDSLLNNIDVCKEALEMYKAVPENILPQLWELNEQLKKAIIAAEKLKKELA